MNNNLTEAQLKDQIINDVVSGKETSLSEGQALPVKIISDLFKSPQIVNQENLSIKIKGGKVIGELTLVADKNTQSPSIEFNKVTFDSPVSISNCHFNNLSFNKCNLVSISIDDVDIETTLDLAETTVSQHTELIKITTNTESYDKTGINLSHSELNTLKISNAEIKGKLNLSASTINGEAYLTQIQVTSKLYNFKF